MHEEKNFDNFLQSIVILYIWLCSVGTAHFEGRVVYQKLLNKKKGKKYRLIHNMMSFEEKKIIGTVKYDVICD